MLRSSPVAFVALLLSSLAAFPQARQTPPALASLVEAERSFARTSVERGVREAFLAYFADDGINFQPGPTRTRAAILSRPAPAERPPVTLNWFPVFGDASAAGDLGFTTGPYVVADNSPRKEPPAFGYYFSVWRKQADGAWKVVLDLGVPAPVLDVSPAAVSTFTPAPASGWNARGAKADARSALAELRSEDGRFAGLSLTGGPRRAFARYLSEDARLLRSGETVLVGAKAIEDYLLENVAKLSWKVTDGGAAASGDFGYTYGRYELIPTVVGKGDNETGYYARVWRRERGGRWRAVMNVLHAQPAEKK